MKKKVLKIFLIQVIIFFIASSYIPHGLFIDWYRHKHLIPTHSLGNFIYDNNFATFLANWQRICSESFIPKTTQKYAYSLSNLTSNHIVNSILADVFLIAFWMIILNIILLIFLKIKKLYIK